MIDAVLRALSLAQGVLNGKVPDPAGFARELLSIGMDLVPADELKGFLDEQAAARADTIADAAEAAKFGS